MQRLLKDTYIKNDKGRCREIYFLLCKYCGLHSEINPDEYKWPWVWVDGNLNLIQHAPEMRYVRDKRRITMDELIFIYYMFVYNKEV